MIKMNEKELKEIFKQIADNTSHKLTQEEKELIKLGIDNSKNIQELATVFLIKNFLQNNR
jgi:hypothetical protein